MKIHEKRELKKIRIDFTGDDPVIDVEYGLNLCIREYKSGDDEAPFLYAVERGENELIGCFKEKEMALNGIIGYQLPGDCEVTLKARGMCEYLHISLGDLDEKVIDAIYAL